MLLYLKLKGQSTINFIFRINGFLRFLRRGQTSTLSCHDDRWVILTTKTTSGWNNDLDVIHFTAVNVHEKSLKLLDPIPDPPIDGFFAIDAIHVKDGQVFVLLRDNSRLPVWDASSGNLLRIYTIPVVPNSIRGIVPTPGLSASGGFRVFIQTNKTDQVKHIL